MADQWRRYFGFYARLPGCTVDQWRKLFFVRVCVCVSVCQERGRVYPRQNEKIELPFFPRYGPPKATGSVSSSTRSFLSHPSVAAGELILRNFTRSSVSRTSPARRVTSLRTPFTADFKDASPVCPRPGTPLLSPVTTS